jgi:hypothetical protein
MWRPCGWPPRDRADVFRLHHEFQAADAGSATIVVDAASVVFALWREADRWWAAGHHDGYGLVIEARGIPLGDVRLARVHDLEPYIAGAAGLSARAPERRLIGVDSYPDPVRCISDVSAMRERPPQCWYRLLRSLVCL